MEIVTEHQHRLLAFVNACNHAGYSPTDDEVVAWFEAPVPREAEYQSKTLPPIFRTTSMFEDILNQHNNFGNSILNEIVKSSSGGFSSWYSNLSKPRTVREMTRPAETPLEHMVRILWLARSEDGQLEITRLGRAMLQTAENEATLIEDLTVMYLGADDPLSYPLLVGALATAESGLLVDPYLKVEDVVSLHQRTRINRLLVGNGKKHRSDNAAISLYLENGIDQFEVRMSYRLHDRLFLEPDGTISMLGTSLNGVGRKATVLMTVPDAASKRLQEHYEELWDEAEILHSVTDSSEDTAEDTDADE